MTETEGTPRSFRELAGDVLASWRGHFAEIARELRQQVLRPAQSPLTLVYSADHIAVLRHEGDAQFELGRVPRDEFAAMALQRLLEGNVSGRDAALVLPAFDVLRPSVRMPRANSATLRKALEYELPRLAPLEPSELYFDHAVPPGKNGAMTDIQLRIIRRASVDDAVAQAHAAGLSVSAIGFEGDGRAADWLSFPVDRPAYARAQLRRWATPLLAALAVLLFIVFLTTAYARGEASTDAAEDLVMQERARAAGVEKIEREIRMIDKQTVFLARQKQSPLLVAIIADLTRLLPDNTWISEIAVNGRKVRIQGFSHASSSLVALIERSQRFEHAQFVAPLTQSGPDGTERFDLTFEVKP